MTAGPYGIGSERWPGLAKAMEECGELIQAAAKIIAVEGSEDSHHWNERALTPLLEDEIADVRAAITFLMAENDLNTRRINIRAMRKLATFNLRHKEHAEAVMRPGDRDSGQPG